MMEHAYQVVVIGAGPAGQKAAVQAAKAGCSVLLVDAAREPGGECVRRGTIPSKALQQAAKDQYRLKVRQNRFVDPRLRPGLPMSEFMDSVGDVTRAHEQLMRDQLERNQIRMLRGRAYFVSPHHLHVERPGRDPIGLRAEKVILATGSRPRQLVEIPIDHEYIFDSDSILSMHRLPQSLIVVGAGVIGAEYASIFQALGVDVTLIDRATRPLGFLDHDISDVFLKGFVNQGGSFIGDLGSFSLSCDGVGGVKMTGEGISPLRAERALVCLGRQADVDGLCLDEAGVELDRRSQVIVDANYRTTNPDIYAAGDVIGPPGLAAAAMEEGRRACRAALGLSQESGAGPIPTGIYAMPEIGMVGLSESDAIACEGEILTGTAEFCEIARGQIAGNIDGRLKLIASAKTHRLLGVGIVGEGATELIHLGQAAIISEWKVDAFVDNVFNFPTLGEAYRVAALDLLGSKVPPSPLATV